MTKTILITGATDGIGLETAKLLVSQGHFILLHGRNSAKLKQTEKMLTALAGGKVESYLADLSHFTEVENLVLEIAAKHKKLDVLINNAGVFKTPDTITQDGLDVRFAVNAIAPYLLTNRLLPLLQEQARVINLSSAAQMPIKIEALLGMESLPDMDAYAQSKLAITMCSHLLAQEPKFKHLIIIAVNPGSMLGTKMVKQGFGVPGRDIGVGAEILAQMALEDSFADATGKYFDNDSRQFAPPHSDALDLKKCDEIAHLIEVILTKILG